MGCGKTIYAISTHLIHAVYFILISWRMFYHLEKFGNPSVEIGFGITCTVIGVLTFLALVFILKSDDWNIKIKWLPNLIFVCSCVIQYGITLHYSHKLPENSPFAKRNRTESSSRTECITLEILDEKVTFYILISIFPILIITNLLYHKTDDKNGGQALCTAFTALDTIDMADLIFADIGCFQNFETGYLVVFYIACLASAILTVFTEYGLEQQLTDEKHDGKHWFATFFNMIFNDLLFFFLRVTTMVKSRHAYFGVIFAMKECLTLFFRCCLLFYKPKASFEDYNFK